MLCYLAKVRSSSFGISGRKCRRIRNILWCLNTRPIFMHLTCCFNFRFLNSRRFYLNKCCKLKQHFLHVWHGADRTIIDNAIDVAHVWGKRQTLRATIVTIFSHMTRDSFFHMTVFVKCVTIFRLFFLDFNTISYFWLSQSSAAIYWRCVVLGNITRFCCKFSWLSSSERILKIR